MYPTKLRLESLNHCYIQLPEAFTYKEKTLKTGAIIVIKSIQNDHELQVMWNGQLAPSGYAQLDLCFAKANRLNDDESIILSLVEISSLSDCVSCKVELIDASEYSIISQHFDADVLDKCKLIKKGLVIPIFLLQHVKVLIRVLDFQPEKDFAILTKWTEMQFEGSSLAPSQPNEVTDIPIEQPIPFVSCLLAIDYRPKFHLGSMLICGERGSGKTFMLKSILNNYRKYKSELFNFKQLRGKRPESIKKRLDELRLNALGNQPFILGLDDIDSMVSRDSKQEDEEEGQAVIYRLRLIDTFCHMLKQMERLEDSKESRIVIIATCRSLETIDDRLSSPVGRAYFNHVIRIGNPNLQERENILRNIVREHKQVHLAINDEEMRYLSQKCDSFMPLDLRRLVERGIIRACSRSLSHFNSNSLTLEMRDLVDSLNDYVPSSLRGVTLQAKTSKTFDNVGGMKKIKEALMKTILLQIKYQKLFQKSPIRPQNSLLLYGPPGCGKTLIAEALTNHESLNSICVKGPELLSKYIGASEASVRDLFRRAETARPCVIFFDEFESLVTRRGSDSTGVTDRVVNQFLTLMDGVEGLSSNVFILAASSRPDMIDPAILRPGRLDRHIYCPLPDQEDRLDILRVLSRGIEIEACLEQWASKLENFTGADIQSFLYSAHLKALHELTGQANIMNEETNSEARKATELNIIVKHRHLEESFNSMEQEVAKRFNNMSTHYLASIRRATFQVSTRATLA